VTSSGGRGAVGRGGAKKANLLVKKRELGLLSGGNPRASNGKPRLRDDRKASSKRKSFEQRLPLGAGEPAIFFKARIRNFVSNESLGRDSWSHHGTGSNSFARIGSVGTATRQFADASSAGTLIGHGSFGFSRHGLVPPATRFEAC